VLLWVVVMFMGELDVDCWLVVGVLWGGLDV